MIDEDDTKNEFYDLSMQGLSKAYSIDERDYESSLIKEANPEYKNEAIVC